MTSSPSNSNSEPVIIEQVITEFFAKSLHIILESRYPYVSSRNYSADLFTSSPSSLSSSSSGRDKWFNLASRDCPAALGKFDLWRQSNFEPLIVDVILVRRRSKESPSESWSSGHDEFLSYDNSEKIVERWVVQYESRKSNKIPCGRLLPVRITVLLRSLYTTVRLLPAYRVFRELNSSGQISSFSLSHKISSFVKPFTRAQDAEMNQFSFVPIDAPCGMLSLSVSYLPTLEDVSSEPSTPVSAQFIPDYVGSPTTDPLKRLQCLPSADIGQVTTASASETSSSESKLQPKKSSGDLYSGMTLQKILYCGKDEVGNLSGRKLSSCSSPRIPSRSSSRFSFLDEFDDSEFSCPFTLDDEDLMDSYRVEPTDADVCAGENMVSGELVPVRRSPDALVGALVRMLKTAAPLRQDLLNSAVPSPSVKDEVSNHGIQYNKVKEAGMEKFDTASGSMITASGLSRSRTAADALEELKRFKEMKELLLRQSGSQSLDVDVAKIGEEEENVEQTENFASEGSYRI